MKVFIWLTALFGIGLFAVEAQKPSRDLFDYIREARKLGLSDEKIKANALSAGWDQATINRTYGVLRLLNNEEPAPGESMPGSGSAAASSLDEYHIGAGDTLQITVWKEPDASVPEVVVRADGKITLPLVKEVEVAGLTPKQLEALLVRKLATLIREPDVTVIPRRISSAKVYVLGAVRKEGPVLITGPMTVLQAITEAGGLTEYAKKKKIYILRMENGAQLRLPFDYQAVLEGENMEMNILVRPEDTIVVPQ